jgi:hypothetical protein
VCGERFGGAVTSIPVDFFAKKIGRDFRVEPNAIIAVLGAGTVTGVPL